jgi:hypothetical protein
MRPKNFPARKLRRQLLAAKKDINSEENITLLNQARNLNTKKDRSGKLK